MDQDNPAVTRQLAVPPAILEQVGQDGKALQSYTRKFLMAQLSVLQDKMRDVNVPLAQRMQYAELLAKYSDLPTTPKDTGKNSNPNGNAPGFSVQIVFSGNAPQAAPLPRAEVVDAVLTSKQQEAGE
jgi:hypothetical protein